MFRIALRLILLVPIAFGSTSYGSETEDRIPLAGKQLADALAQRRSIVTSGVTLKQTLLTLQRDIRIAVVLDRSIDPSMVPEVSTKYITNEQLIRSLAEACSLQTSIGDRYVFIGMPQKAGRLKTLTEINRQTILSLRSKLDKAVYLKLSEPLSASWPALSEPQKLIQKAANSVGIRISNPESIPHDLWPEVTLPKLTFSDYATLILNQFDMTFEIDDQATLAIVLAKSNVRIEQRYRVSSKDKTDINEKWMNAFPDLDVKWSGSTAIVSASIETHEQLEQLRIGKAEKTIDAASLRNRKFTMNVPSGTTLKRLLATFEQSGIHIQVEGRTDGELEKLLQQTVEFDVSGSPADEFFLMVFRGWDASVEVGDEEVLVRF
ncbi:MAG: hypothetical protein WAO83_00195 [Fuerstiella sp.]